jgi:hypothetical protein
MKRLRISENLKYLTGMSGGARICSQFAILRGGFAGIILQGAGFLSSDSGPNKGDYLCGSVNVNKDLAIYATFGKRDSNYSEIEKLKKFLDKHARLEIETFEGGHVWAPVECVNNAFDWLDEQLMDTSNKERLKAAVMYKLSRADEMESKFDKYVLLRSLYELKPKLGRITDKTEASKLNGMLTELRALKSDPEIKQLEQAEKIYLSAEKQENAYRTKSRKGSSIQRKMAIKSIIKRYESVIQKYPGTIFSQKAEKKIASLKGEIE